MAATALPALLFDLDGVLIDTEGTYTRIWAEIDRAYPTGYADFTERIKGTNLHSILTNYFPDPSKREGALAMLNRYEATMTYTPFAGARELVEDARARGIKCAVVTSSDKLKMEKLYAQQPWVRDLFDITITGDMVAHSKPHPECFITAARLLGREPEECIVVEDSLLGIEAGLRSGAKVIALTTTVERSAITDKVSLILDHISQIDLDRLLTSEE